MISDFLDLHHRNFMFVKRALTLEEIEFYERHGYLALGRTLTERGLQEMRRQCMEAWNGEKKQYNPDGTWLQNSLLVNIHHQAPIARDFYFRGPLVRIAAQLIGPNIKGVTSQLTFKMRGNTKPFGWHQDNGYGELDPYNTLTTLTALDDADETNGCLWLIPGSHREGQIDVRDQYNVEKKAAGASLDVQADESRAIPMPMRAGESLIFHCWTLHKSDGNFSDRDRRILFLRYADADAVEVYNQRRPRLGRLLCGTSRFAEVREFEADLEEVEYPISAQLGGSDRTSILQ